MFTHLLNLAIDKELVTRQVDVITTYLYGNLDIDIYVKVLTSW